MQPYMDGETDTGAGSAVETQAEQTDTQQTENTTTQETESQTETQTDLPKLKVKFNHEEKEIPYEEAVQLAQKGMNYDKAVERAKQEARDNWITEQGYEWQGKPITTEAEYKTALREQQLLEQHKDLPLEVAQKLTKVDQLEERLKFYEKNDLLTRQDQTLANKPFYNEWKNEVKETASNLNCDYETAYTLLAEQKMPEIIAGYEAKLKAQETNERNAGSSPGSLTGNGASPNQYFSPDQVKSMSPSQVKQHYSAIEESMKKWNK